MKTKDFLKEHSACKDGAKWALSISEEMADVWDAMIEQGKHEWLIWAATRPGVFQDSSLRKLACRFVRETPLADGRKVWDLLTDERSRKVIEVTEFYAAGKTTYGELQVARAAACDAVRSVTDDAAFATDAAAYAAAYDARDAARAAARDAADAAADNAAHAAYYTDADAADAAARAAAAHGAAFAAYAAAHDAAYTAAKAAQVRMIAELGNPFKERAGR